MKTMSCTGRRVCVPADPSQSTGSNGDSVQMIAQMETELTAKIVEEWDTRFSRVEAILESLSEASSKSVVAQEQLMVTMKTSVDLISKALGGSSSATVDIDKLLTAQLQPLTLALDNLQHHRHTNQNTVGNGYAYSVPIGTTSIAQEGVARGRLQTELSEDDSGDPNMEAFKAATDTFIVKLNSHNEDLKSHHNEANSKMHASLEGLKQHLDTHFDRLGVKLQQEPPAISSKQRPAVSPREVEPIFDLRMEGKSKTNLASERRLYSGQSDEDVEHKIKLKQDESASAIFLHDGNVATKPYVVEDYYKTSGFSQWLARDHMFQGFTLFVVFLNTIWIGYDADHGQPNIYENFFVHQFIGQSFNAFFFFEWIIRFLAFRTCHDAVRDGWFQFDSFLVWSMVLDAWILQVIIYAMASDSGSHKLPIPTQPLRTLRILKLSRMAKLMNNLPELVTMIKGLFRSCRAILATIILVLLMNYVWAIIMHMILKKEDELNLKLYQQSFMDFRSVGHCMWILLQDGTLMLDNASPLMTELVYHDNAWVVLSGVLFTFYSLISALLLLQMLIGVLCDVVAKVNHEQRDAEAIGLVKQELLEKLMEYDKDGDGHLTREDLMHVMCDSRSVAVLKHLKINRGFLFQLQCAVFANADRMTIKKALEMIILCRSDNPATVETLAGGFCFVGTELHMLQQSLAEMMESLLRLRE